ncbi:hypothetical protein PLICRDRAFT_47473 [Plicaturopsis crispa FD-325 SS-3]|uniref:Uncharacterized protein n=1 Tax=Plicaturopsis crispa FD-325 SS-3 TaxID=944288 RepID=A0A0C9T426_PLICR|nr:hypothetical protein PLICRDRAFT_47473 [Plicaturopsis crispa FD-325 SS-3]
MFPKKRQLPQCRQGCFEEDGVTPILKKLCAHSSSGRKRQRTDEGVASESVAAHVGPVPSCPAPPASCVAPPPSSPVVGLHLPTDSSQLPPVWPEISESFEDVDMDPSATFLAQNGGHDQTRPRDASTHGADALPSVDYGVYFDDWFGEPPSSGDSPGVDGSFDMSPAHDLAPPQCSRSTYTFDVTAVLDVLQTGLEHHGGVPTSSLVAPSISDTSFISSETDAAAAAVLSEMGVEHLAHGVTSWDPITTAPGSVRPPAGPGPTRRAGRKGRRGRAKAQAAQKGKEAEYILDPETRSRRMSDRLATIMEKIHELVSMVQPYIFFYISRPETVLLGNGQTASFVSQAMQDALSKAGLEDHDNLLHELVKEHSRVTTGNSNFETRKLNIKVQALQAEKEKALAEAQKSLAEEQAARRKVEAELAALRSRS